MYMQKQVADKALERSYCMVCASSHTDAKPYTITIAYCINMHLHVVHYEIL